jgi:hypothetical protein
MTKETMYLTTFIVYKNTIYYICVDFERICKDKKIEKWSV